MGITSLSLSEMEDAEAAAIAKEARDARYRFADFAGPFEQHSR